MKINNFQGDPTDTSSKKQALRLTGLFEAWGGFWESSSAVP